MSEFQWFFIGLTITMLVFPWLIYLIGVRLNLSEQ